MKKNLKCPCGSGKLYETCCHPFLQGERLPETALQLMRSRYFAYSHLQINYIQQTMSGKAAENFDADNAKKWAEGMLWCGLTIIDPGKQQTDIDTDEVEFVARYVDVDYLHLLHERSQFQKIEGKWFYTSGTLIPHAPIKINPTDPCPCGSRKKFHKCCG